MAAILVAFGVAIRPGEAAVQISGNVYTNGPFIIGVSNSNAGVVVNGGTVFNSGYYLIVGAGATTNNSVTVNGSGSLWNCGFLRSGDDGQNGNYGGGNHYNINSVGGMIVGDPNLYGFGAGQGSISIGSKNTFLVTDSGSYFKTYGVFGAGDGNTISVLNGGAFTCALNGTIRLGNSNIVVFSDSGTSVNLGSGSISGDAYGTGTNNNISILSGASLTCGAINMGVGSTLLFDGAQTRCITTNGMAFSGTIYTNGGYFAGYGFGGMLTIRNGAQVTAGGLYAMGSPAAQMIVSDPSSSLTVSGASEYLAIGGNNTDTNALMQVTNGASLTLQLDCLMNGQNGLLNVVGTNSLFNCPTNRISVGGGNAGGNICQIAVGGKVVAGGLQVGSIGNAISNSVSVAGSLYVTNSTGTAVFELHDARATCNGGLIVADQLICGLGGGLPGILTANSGTLKFKSATVANGLPLVIGDGTNTANYVMQGGTHLFSQGIVISSNSVLSGCGTIMGSVTNYGTILLGGCDITFSNSVVNFGTIIATNGLPHFLSTFSNQGAFVINPPAFQTLMKTNGAFKFNWNAVEGVNYQVQYKTNLIQTNWINFGSSILATNSTMTVSDFLTNSQRFYRVMGN